MSNVIDRLISAVMNLMYSEYLKKAMRTPVSKDKGFSGFFNKVKYVLNSKEWKQLEVIMDEVCSGRWNDWILNELKHIDPSVQEFLRLFASLSDTKEFKQYRKLEEYRKCTKSLSRAYDKYWARDMLKCQDIVLHQMLALVSTKEWYAFSDFTYSNMHVIKKYLAQKVAIWRKGRKL